MTPSDKETWKTHLTTEHGTKNLTTVIIILSVIVAFVGAFEIGVL